MEPIYDLIILGAGPAGLTVAIKLALKGPEVTIFERKSKIGGMMRYGIPAFRLPHTVFDRYKKILTALGIHVRPNTTIGGVLPLDRLLEDGYDAMVKTLAQAWTQEATAIASEINRLP